VAHTIILAIQKAEISGGSWFEASLGKYFVRPYLEKPFIKIGLVEWILMKTLSSSPSTANK
jgi:hypothetical protein